MTEVSERLRKVRAHLKKTQKEMSRGLSLGETTWQNYELGGYLPGFETLTKLLEWGISPEWIMSGEGSMLSEVVTAANTDRPATDRELMGRCIDQISKLYQELNIKLPMLDMGREAADLHDEVLASGASSVEEYVVALRVLIAQKRRALLTAPPSGKLQDSA